MDGQVRRLSGSVRQQQETWLLDCLQRNRTTEYGRRYGFAKIRTAEAYRDQVPLAGYDDLAPWIERMAAGKADVLFAGVPVAFECTGGSTGGSKLIPYSAASLVDFQAALLPWLTELIAAYDLGRGSAYWAISPALRPPQQTSGGISIGLPDAAYLGADAVAAFMGTLAVPAWVGTMTNLHDWQLATLYWLILRQDVELISVWSPTYLLSLLTALPQRAAELEVIFRQGATLADHRLPAGHRLPADPSACYRLQEYLEHQDSKSKVLWPSLKVVSCWADASSRPFFDQLRRLIPQANFQPKGLLATEGVVTVPDRQGRPVLTAGSGFYEFLDQQAEIRFAHELLEGERYEVVLTTSGGLYRYQTGDRVVCQGWTDALPILSFIGRCGLVSDLVGEKLSDDFVGQCLHNIPGFRMLVPSVHSIPKYVLILDDCSAIPAEALTLSVEAALSKNPQYAYARRTGQLDCLEVRCLSDPSGRFITHKLACGARIGDIKMPSLCPDPHILAAFMETVMETFMEAAS